MSTTLLSALSVCGLEELDAYRGRSVTHVLSILDPDWPDPEAFLAFAPHARKVLRFHDVIEPAPTLVLPQISDAEAILAFGRDAGDDLRHLLIHCHAGISRSTAAMLMILAQAHPDESEDAVAERLLHIRPQAWPNSRLVTFADALLGRQGRLEAATAQIYARRLSLQPELIDAMRLGHRGREVEIGLAAGGAAEAGPDAQAEFRDLLARAPA